MHTTSAALLPPLLTIVDELGTEIVFERVVCSGQRREPAVCDERRRLLGHGGEILDLDTLGEHTPLGEVHVVDLLPLNNTTFKSPVDTVVWSEEAVESCSLCINGMTHFYVNATVSSAVRCGHIGAVREDGRLEIHIGLLKWSRLDSAAAEIVRERWHPSLRRAWVNGCLSL